MVEGLDVGDVDDEGVAGLGADNLEGACKVVDLGQVDVTYVVGAVVIADLPAGPVEAFDLDGFPWLDGADGGD